MYAIFDTLEQAQVYVELCNAAQGIPHTGDPEAPFPNGWTLAWAIPRPHNLQWSVLVPDNMSAPETAAAILENL